MPILSDADLLAAIDSEEQLALDSRAGELQKERVDALARYRGEPLGNEIPGRSQVVDKSVLDTIEWIMPSLVRVYLGGDKIGQFDATGPEDEAAAEAETDACNWYLTTKNDLFSEVNSTLRDALLLKNGYMVGYWRVDKSVVRETYKGLADEEVALLEQDPDVEVVEDNAYPDPAMALAQQVPMPGTPGMPAPQQPTMLHDVIVERKRADEYVAVESVPPEELIVARRHRTTSLLNADFVQWRRRTTVGQLRAEGFDIPDDVPGFHDFTQEAVERARFHEEDRYYDQTPDPARKIVQFKDTYILLDLDGQGKGTPQLWRVCHIASDQRIFLKEQVEQIPFAAFSPIIYPHSHIGSSVYDVIQDLSIVKTAAMRLMLDSAYQSLAPQKAVNVDNVNLDDLLISRPGGVIRCEGDPSTAVMAIVTPDITSNAITLLEYVDNLKQQRTGIDQSTVGMDANQLNKTATGVQMMQSAANARLELIARTMAGGFKDLFLIVHHLALQHSTKPLQMKLNNKWVAVNPREWTKRTDFSISVGMGTGTPEAQLQKLMMLAPGMQQTMQLGLAGPQEVYNLACEIYKAAGYRHHDKFIHPPQIDPQTGQPVQPPSQPDPQVQAAQAVAQAQVQQAQIKTQADTQQKMAELSLEEQQREQDRQWDFRKEMLRAGTQALIEVHKGQVGTREAIIAHVHQLGQTLLKEHYATQRHQNPPPQQLKPAA